MFDFDISMFGFVALWSPIFLIVMIFTILLYLYLIRNSLTKKLFFVSGIVLLYIFLGSPIDLIAHLIFSFHMIQMAGIYFIAIPFILIGLIDNIQLKKINPLISIGLFNILFSMYHLPVIFDYIMVHHIVHKCVHFVLIISCFYMWIPIINKNWNPIKKIGYIFANGVLLTPACALIIFADKILYSVYTDPVQWSQMIKLCVPSEIFNSLSLDGPYFFQWISPLDDQRLGGVLMKIVQEIILGIFIGYVFFTDFKKEQKIDRIEDIRISSR